MKKLLSIVVLFAVLVGSVFAIPKPIQTKTLEDEVLTFWEITETHAIITSNASIEDQFRYGFDEKHTLDNVTNPDIIYLIAKYDYILAYYPDLDYYDLLAEVDGEYKLFTFYYDEGEE